MKDKDEEVNKGLKLLVKSSAIVFFAFILSKIFSYLYRIIIARFFGPEIYGLFSLSIVIVGWFVAVSALGFTEGIVRYVSLYRGKNEINKIRYLFRFSSRILFLSTISTAIILFLFSEFISISLLHNQELLIFLKIFSIIIPFWAFSLFFLSVMRGFEKIKEVSFIDSIIQNFSKLILLVILVFFVGYHSNAIIFSFFFGIIIIFLLSYLYCRFKIPQIFLEYNLSKKIKKKISGKFVSYSWPILFLGIISGIFYWIDSFAIGFFKSATEVGFYNAVIPIALLFNLAPEIFLQLFFPMITREYSLKKIRFIKEVSKQIGKWILMVNFPAFLLMIFFPGVIINILFGSEYLVAENSLRILSFGGLFSSLFIISNNLISMVGKTKVLFYDILAISLLNVILNILLIPKPFIFGIDNSLGINGAAIATTISFIFFNLLFLFQARYYTSIIPLKGKMFNIFFASIIPFFALIFLKKLVEINFVSFVLLTITFIATYTLLLFLFKAFDKEDIVIFTSFKKKIKMMF
ncbi:MAG TPA: flippase [Candidatus Nanoarchaeia archaeon]|nr:flippase [Candidatus Nanoarchaeia archaeon]